MGIRGVKKFARGHIANWVELEFLVVELGFGCRPYLVVIMSLEKHLSSFVLYKSFKTNKMGKEGKISKELRMKT